MKSVFIILGFFSLLSVATAENLLIRCQSHSAEICQSKTANALHKIGCLPTATINCQTSENESNIVYCDVMTQNCDEPSANLVSTTTCFESSKVSLTKADRSLTLSWTMGFFQTFVKDVCKK